MAKKASGLGRGLGDLLEDNMPQVKQNHRVILKKVDSTIPSGISEVDMTPKQSPLPPLKAKQETATSPKPLFDQPVRNRSVKANFKKFK
ncbi:MAG: hypothetical protein IJY47_05760 [Clostridia bacterium]|nr:hypothetical protein [Clostridia bacterium]